MPPAQVESSAERLDVTAYRQRDVTGWAGRKLARSIQFCCVTGRLPRRGIQFCRLCGQGKRLHWMAHRPRTENRVLEFLVYAGATVSIAAGLLFVACAFDD